MVSLRSFHIVPFLWWFPISFEGSLKMGSVISVREGEGGWGKACLRPYQKYWIFMGNVMEG